MAYNPSDVGIKGSLFGFPYDLKEAEHVVIPVPWDVTVSYGKGTMDGPLAIMEASPQLDLALYGIEKPWEFKTVMEPIPHEMLHVTKEIRPIAEDLIEDMESGDDVTNDPRLVSINESTDEMVAFVYEKSKKLLEEGKLCSVLGGDHSTPLGLIKALADDQEFGILQIDAHMDMRDSYEGFVHSHASIMYNAMKIENVNSLVQVGIRDFSPIEEEYIMNSKKPIHVFFDDQIKAGIHHGINWSGWVQNIINVLPDSVYVSFDIDGLNPIYCPNTGTPVPGGLEFDQAVYLLDEIVRAGKKIVGFDLCEVCPSSSSEWDANVGARILYRLSTYMAISHGKLSFSS